MAQGTAEVFEATAGYYRDKDVDFASVSWKCALLTNPVTSLLDSETNPALGSPNCTEVTGGGGYTAKGIALPMSNTDTGGVATLKTSVTDGKITWTKAAGSPTDIKSAIVYDDAATTPDDKAVWFVDMTSDNGVTPVSLVADDVFITFGSGGVVGAILTMTA